MKPKLFVGSSGESLDVAYAVQENLDNDADVVVWKQGVFDLMSYTLDDLVKATHEHDFAAFVFAPDDLIKIRDKQSFTVRDNVVFELGLFIGRLGKERCFIITPKDARDFHLLTDLEGITTATFTPKENLQAALGPACNQIRKSIRKLGRVHACEKIIYDGRGGFEQFGIRDKGNTLFDAAGNATSPKGEGEIKIGGEGELQIIRSNVEGRYEILLQDKGQGKPTVESQQRKIQVRCEVRVESGEHTLRFVLKDERAQKIEGDKTVKVAKNDWQHIDLGFLVPAAVDLSFRIDEQVVSQTPGSVKIRNLVISEKL